jgi:hypothetical protein
MRQLTNSNKNIVEMSTAIGMTNLVVEGRMEQLELQLQRMEGKGLTLARATATLLSNTEVLLTWVSWIVSLGLEEAKGTIWQGSGDGGRRFEAMDWKLVSRPSIGILVFSRLPALFSLLSTRTRLSD